MSVRVVCTSIFHILVGYSISLGISSSLPSRLFSNAKATFKKSTGGWPSCPTVTHLYIDKGSKMGSRPAYQNLLEKVKSVASRASWKCRRKKNVISPPLWSARQHPIGGHNQKTRKGQLDTKVDLQANGLINTSRISTVIIEKNNLYYYMTNYIHKDQ